MQKINFLLAILAATFCSVAAYRAGLNQPRSYLRAGIQWQFSEAAERGDVREMQRLHSLGAAIDAIPSEEQYQGIRAIELAAISGRPEAVRWLIQQGADIKHVWTPDTPLNLAEDHLKDAQETVALLRASGAVEWNKK